MNVSLGMVLEAREHLKGVVHRTDLVPSKVLSTEDYQVYLKTESLQDTGSFKVRGAYIKIASLTPEERACGVIASSAGNHAQGVALAARTFGIPATIVMPEGAPLSKIKATRELGANVVLKGAVYDDAYAHACKLQKESGATFIHPFNDPMVIAGQGTIGLEILDDMPDIDAIVVPIGGGGLAAGIAVAAAPIVSFNVGAGNPAKIRETLRYSFRTIALTSVVVMAISLGLGQPLIHLFAGPGHVFDLTWEGLRLFSPVFLFIGWNVFLSGYFTALGNGFLSALISTLRSLILVVLFILLLPKLIGVNGIWLTMPCAEAVTIFISAYCYRAHGRAYLAS